MQPDLFRTPPAGEDYSAAFSRTLLKPGREAPALVCGPAGKAAARRFAIYRNNVTVSLIDALAAIYPAVQRITGFEFFRAMARFHVRATPPSSPLLFEYGRDFPAFIAHYPYAGAMPWLADVARVERAWLDAYHAADAATLSASDLARAPSERLAALVFTPHPTTRLLRSSYAAVTIFAGNRTDGPIEQIDAGEAEDALITRPDSEVAMRRLAPGQFEFLSALMAGQELGKAAEAAIGAHSDFDIGMALMTLIESGACASATCGENR